MKANQRNKRRRINTTVDNNVIFLIVLLVSGQHSPATAQKSQIEDGAPSSSNGHKNPTTHRIDPVMANLLVGLILTFFVLGCLSMYACRCLENIAANQRATTSGLDAAVIDSFPTFLYSDVKGLKIGKGALECAVCINEFEDGEILRLLPKCCHVFHPGCINTWLVSHVTCPVCRANLVPVAGVEAGFHLPSCDSLSESTHPTRSPLAQNQVHEISELDIDLRTCSPVVPPFSFNSFKQEMRIDSPEQTTPDRFYRLTPKKSPIKIKFSRSHSTGHSLIQPGEDCERYTLRLPEDVIQKFMNSELSRAHSHVALPSVGSPKKGYRSPGFGNSPPVHYGEGRLDRWGFTLTPPFVSRSRWVQSPAQGVRGNLLKSVKSPLDRLFGVTKKDDDVGERSFNRLTGNSPV